MASRRRRAVASVKMISRRRRRSRRPSGVEHAVAEGRHDLRERRLPGLDHLACDQVRVDDRDPERGEAVGDRGLAARDAAVRATRKGAVGVVIRPF